MLLDLLGAVPSWDLLRDWTKHGGIDGAAVELSTTVRRRILLFGHLPTTSPQQQEVFVIENLVSGQ